jgi:hypothetical protein
MNPNVRLVHTFQNRPAHGSVVRAAGKASVYSELKTGSTKSHAQSARVYKGGAGSEGAHHLPPFMKAHSSPADRMAMKGKDQPLLYQDHRAAHKRSLEEAPLAFAVRNRNPKTVKAQSFGSNSSRLIRNPSSRVFHERRPTPPTLTPGMEPEEMNADDEYPFHASMSSRRGARKIPKSKSLMPSAEGHRELQKVQEQTGKKDNLEFDGKEEKAVVSTKPADTAEEAHNAKAKELEESNSTGATDSAQAHYNTLQHTATHCNTLQHTATHCNTLQHTATYCNTL